MGAMLDHRSAEIKSGRRLVGLWCMSNNGAGREDAIIQSPLTATVVSPIFYLLQLKSCPLKRDARLNQWSMPEHVLSGSQKVTDPPSLDAFLEARNKWQHFELQSNFRAINVKTL